MRRTGADPQILYAIGYSSYQLGEHRRALGVFQRVLRVRPKDGDALFMAGLASAQLARHRPALQFFERALKAGLKTERPQEARRYIRMLKKLLATRLKSGALLDLRLQLGYDSHPRLGGSAASSGTSDGASGTATGYTRVVAGVGYRWLRALRRRAQRVLRGALSLAYRFDQSVVFTDLEDGGMGGPPGRRADATGGLSLQVHGLHLAGRLLHQRWDLGLRVSGRAELSGLRNFTPLVGGGAIEMDGGLRWHRLTSTRLALGYLPQWALTDDMGYLTGHGLWAGLQQSLRYRWLRLVARYRAVLWWLGRLQTPSGDCTAGETCAVDVPYSNHAHRVGLDLATRAPSWLRFDVAIGITHRTYWSDGVYRPPGGGTLQKRRVDLVQHYGVQVGFRLYPRLWLQLAYAFTRCDSTIDAETVGLEEGYDRHRVWATLMYRRW